MDFVHLSCLVLFGALAIYIYAFKYLSNKQVDPEVCIFVAL